MIAHDLLELAEKVAPSIATAVTGQPLAGLAIKAIEKHFGMDAPSIKSTDIDARAKLKMAELEFKETIIKSCQVVFGDELAARDATRQFQDKHRGARWIMYFLSVILIMFALCYFLMIILGIVDYSVIFASVAAGAMLLVVWSYLG